VDENELIAISESTRIPLSELTFRFSPSQGPGGQHVNRAHTQVTLLFDVVNSPSLNQAARERILDHLSSRVDKRGVLRVSAQDSRSQKQNRRLAITRFAALLRAALEQQPERVPSKPPAAAGKKRLDSKRKKGRRKQERGQDWSAEA
jgi:ribosome-associated protein